jgi:hypothetical protein
VLARFVANGGFQITFEQDDDSGEYVARMHSLRKPPVPPPARASVIVGDALNNLRSALDYVVWQLAAAPSKKNQFPIFDTPEGFESHKDRYLDGVPVELWAKFESYQPYHGGGHLCLGAVGKLNDADKHHLLLTAAVAVAGQKGRFTVSGLDSVTVKGRSWVPFEDGAEIYRLALTPHEGSDVNVHAQVPYTVVFAEDESGLAVSVADLRFITIWVSNVVESFAGDF